MVAGFAAAASADDEMADEGEEARDEREWDTEGTGDVERSLEVAELPTGSPLFEAARSACSAVVSSILTNS